MCLEIQGTEVYQGLGIDYSTVIERCPGIRKSGEFVHESGTSRLVNNSEFI